MTALYRCELAEALLYSPAAPYVSVDAQRLLRRLLTLTESQAMDPAWLTESDHARWPLAGRPAGLPAAVAALVWPSASRRRSVGDAVDAASTAVMVRQLAGWRSGQLLLDRETGHPVDVVPTSASPRGYPSSALFDLALEPTEARVRGLLLGPLAAWPVDLVEREVR